MFFSIIIPVYNAEKYLKECVDSILSQTFNDYEIILINDGSKDKSGEICDLLKQSDDRIKVVHKENGGAAIARNIGVDLSTGTYILFIDSDDYVSSDSFLQELYEKASNNTDIICYKFRKYFEESNKFAECTFSLPDIDNLENMGDKTRALIQNDAFYCAPWAKAIRAEIIKKNKIKFEEGLLAEDLEWYFHVMISATSMTSIDTDFIVYRQTPNSSSRTTSTKILNDSIYIIRKWSKTLDDGSIDDGYRIALYNALAKIYCNTLICYSNFKGKEKKQYYGQLKELSHLLKYNLNPRTRTFSKIHRLCGFGLMMTALKVLCKVRSK